MQVLENVEKRRRFIINTVYFVLLAVIAYFIYTYALGICFPLVFAFIGATILQRPRNFLMKKTFLNKGLSCAVCIITLLGVVSAVFALIGVRIVQEVRSVVDYIMVQFSDLPTLVNNVEDFVLAFIGRLPAFISESATEAVASLFTQLREVIAGTSTELTDSIATGLGDSFSFSWITTPLSGVISTVSQIPSAVISMVISIVALCFMTSEYDYIRNFILIQFPEEKRKDLSRAKRLLTSSLSKMAKAYSLIMLITFVEVFGGLTILRLAGIFESEYITYIAIITAIIDIIPILGTGTVLLPWTAYSLIVGNYGMAIGLIIMYVVITVIRQIIEPKLVAGQLGLSPVITVTAMFLGLKFLGILGVFAAPLAVIMLKLLTDEGIIHLWKSPVIYAAEKAEREEQNKKEAEEKETDVTDAQKKED